ncbi:MAG TPA: hypothetical protein VLY20_04945 [Nitrospiria bacterium]|nr:hypothetical protein [Nitrospiria bacterium]
MPKAALKKEKWTLSFDPRLKRLLIKEARKKGIYPVSLLEEVVRERFNPYGHSDVKDSVAYVQEIRKGSRHRSDEAFLKEIRAWQKLSS